MVRLIILISGQATCGSSTLAKKLAEKYNLKYFSPGQFYKKHFSGKETESAIKGWKTEKGSSKSFHEMIDELQNKEVEKGNIVVDGKLSIRMIKKADLRIWLKAREDVRAGRVAKRDGISLEEASKQLKEKDKLERETWKKVYGFDFWDQDKEADLIINTSDLTPEEVLQKVVVEIEKRNII